MLETRAARKFAIFTGYIALFYIGIAAAMHRQGISWLKSLGALGIVTLALAGIVIIVAVVSAWMENGR